MTRILSKPALPFDISSVSFRGAAADLGEALAFLAGGRKPEPETLSRLCQSLRSLQGFLLAEAKEQAGREAVAVDQGLRAVLGAGQVSLVPPFQPVLADAAVHLARAHG